MYLNTARGIMFYELSHIKDMSFSQDSYMEITLCPADDTNNAETLVLSKTASVNLQKSAE